MTNFSGEITLVKIQYKNQHRQISRKKYLIFHFFFSRHPQLNICMESCILRLITGLGNAEITVPRNQGQNQGQVQRTTSVLYGESEELNRVVVLTLARAIHIHGYEQQSTGYFKDILASIMNKTPHYWPTHTLIDFPPILKDFYNEHQVQPDSKEALKTSVNEEYSTWNSMADESNKIQHFSSANNSLFLCVLWKVLFNTEQLPSVAYKILERIGTKQLTAHLRSFCDLLVLEFSISGGADHVNKSIATLNNLIWKYNIIALDRWILCMALRPNEKNEAQVCFFIIQLLLLKPKDFRERVSEFANSMNPEHWNHGEFYTQHMKFHQSFPEKFVFEENPNDPNGFHHLPVYFGNVCLRFIAVFDILIHRFIEIPFIDSKSTERLAIIMDHFAHLYKFHDRPITYLYNTLHYYEKRIRQRLSLKKKLVSCIIGSFKDVRPPGWCLTDQYLEWINQDSDALAEWNIGLDYYVSLTGRLVRSLQGKFPFPYMDWRFNEFPNEGAHALYSTCVEIMGLGVLDPAQVGAKLVDVILDGCHLVDVQVLPDWINAVGLILSYLPDAYLEGLKKRLVSALSSTPLSQWNLPQNPFEMLDFECVNR